MQDRFKFKVLDTTTDKLYNSLEDLSKEEENAHFLLAQDGIIIKKYYNNGEMQLIRMTQYKPIFCTGLKDKNGKLIYEGDIVHKSGSKFNGEKILSEISWCEASAHFVYSDYIGIGGSHEFRTGTALKMEVLGNIYKNPELVRK